jgi:arylsulfatase
LNAIPVRLPIALALAALASAQGTRAAETLPRPEAAFSGRVGLTRLDSTPAWPQPPQAAQGAPNVVLILLDDVGFGATSTFGGLARTPHLDQLAADGLRFNRFHTSAISSPTRAALLTGRNQHQVGFGNLQNIPAGYPSYNTIWKKETASVAEVLKQNGYSTAAFGKWHNTPNWEISAAGPFDRWPTGLGFEHFYGFLAGEDSQWEPHLYRDTVAVEAPAKPEQGYHLTTDLVNEAVHWLHDHQVAAPARPYFLYFASGAVHTPHHVPREWIERSRGRYDQGWDRLREEVYARQKRLGVIPADALLTPRPAGLPAWEGLGAEQKRLYARQMEVYSAYLEHTDAEVGRLLDEVRRSPGGDNTLVLYIVGDNGGSAEGGLDGTITNEAGVLVGADESVASQLAHVDDLGGPGVANHYAAAWAWATTTPFQWTKQVASHFGGTRNPLVVSWPGHVRAPEQVRSQFGHVNDIAATIYDAARITPPEVVNGVSQIPLEGKSLLASFTDPKAPEQHQTQYFEIFGNRAIYQDGWVAAAKRNYQPWNLLHELGKVFDPDFEHDRWELYHVDQDYSEARDLAAAQPAKLEELKAVFDREARRNGVYPLVPFPLGAPTIPGKRTSFVLPGDISALPQAALPDLTGRSHRIEASLQVAPGGARGVIVAEGGRYGGFSLYVKDGRLIYENNTFGQERQTIVASELLPEGRVSVAYEFSADIGGLSSLLSIVPLPKGGTGRLYLQGKLVGEGRLDKFGAFGTSFGESFDIGRDRNSAVSAAYEAPFAFTGKVQEVRLEVR